MTEEVTLEVGGAVYSGWTSVEISRAIGEVAGTFTLSVSEGWAATDGPRLEPRRIRPGASCRVLSNGEPAVTGYVEAYQPSFAPGAHQVTIAGASRPVDFAACAALVPGGQFKGYTLGAIARALAAPFAVGVVAGEGAPIADLQVTPGEKVAEVLGRAAALQGLAIWDDAAGRLVIGRPGAGVLSAPLVQDADLVSGSAANDMADRFSHYLVRAQQPTFAAFGGEGLEASNAIEAEVRDGAVTRYRPLLFAGQASMDQAQALTRVKWERAVRAGGSLSVTATVKGWRRSDGRLWSLNDRAPVVSPWLDLDGRELCVAALRFQKGKGGTVTGLTLVPPEALTPEPPDPPEGAGAALSIIPIGERSSP